MECVNFGVWVVGGGAELRNSMDVLKVRCSMVVFMIWFNCNVFFLLDFGNHLSL